MIVFENEWIAPKVNLSIFKFVFSEGDVLLLRSSDTTRHGSRRHLAASSYYEAINNSQTLICPTPAFPNLTSLFQTYTFGVKAVFNIKEKCRAEIKKINKERKSLLAILYQKTFGKRN